MNEKNVNWTSLLDEMRTDCAIGQKKGLHFMAASVFVWTAVFLVYISDLPLSAKNIYTFWCTGLTFPLAIAFSKVFRIDFAGKCNPLNKAGLLFTCNQLIYLIIPLLMLMSKSETMEKNMLTVFTIVFGAHLLPYSWLYKSKTYFAVAILIPITAIRIHMFCLDWVICAVMIGIQILCVTGLAAENVMLKKNHPTA